MSIYGDANFAEIITSPEFVEAKNNNWHNDPFEHAQILDIAEDIIYTAITDHKDNVSPSWEMRRLSALASLANPGFEWSPLFMGFFIDRQGSANPTDLTLEDLDLGQPGPVATNGLIKGLYERVSMPALKFFDEAIRVIDRRRLRKSEFVGPENYGSAIKYFVDKLQEQQTTLDNESKDQVAQQLKRWHMGFQHAGNKDLPNFVELTNIYHAVRVLPRGIFPNGFTGTLVRFSLEELPNFHREVNISLLRTVSKLDRDEVPIELAMLTDLALTMMGQFERTDELRIALRAIRNLTPSPPTHNALRTVYANAYHLDEPLDIEGLMDVTESLRIIADDAIDDPELTLETQQLAERCSVNAIAQYKRMEDDPDIRPEELQNYKRMVDRIVTSYSRM